MAARQRTGDEESKSVGVATGSKALNPLEWTLAATDSECYFKHKTSGATRHTAPKGMPILGDDYCTVLLLCCDGMSCVVMSCDVLSSFVMSCHVLSGLVMFCIVM